MNAAYLAKIANADIAYRFVHLLFWDFHSATFVKQGILRATAKQPFVRNACKIKLSFVSYELQTTIEIFLHTSN